ncbi:hypothetical protein [Mycobacterium persicum]|uniref:ESX-1 secretion-associated protein n=1 Tax=Mycobacterium persicum TaxID=1487726 RepID=A0A1X0LHK1_9MYCO|nr:hypothetical protein [Mycobacterium persicum]KZS84212.1 hypothetical protein A4G31_18365 [Mycobacterium persicum]ORB59210.1 hypothetical protein BST40_00350 [Mycobacterium persicum]ORB92992.1 hypothetical protein B1T49_19445 [Mycobacterium persicum]ORB98382.1 hypothetical protein B1T44_19690 [Mycobacterium persicum]ORC04773.1 hypothetical protein B1T48_08050 [Mycobacterium persicum]
MRLDHGKNCAGSASEAGTAIDVTAVLAVADKIDAAAELVDDAAVNLLSRLAFGGSSAGRAHTQRGEALRTVLDRLAAELSLWSRAAAEIAVALRTGAQRYADADLFAAGRIA